MTLIGGVVCPVIQDGELDHPRITRLERVRWFMFQISQFICAWADKGHLYQKGKTHRDEYWICAHESYVTLFIYAPTVHFMIRMWKYSFQEGKQKVLSRTLAVIILRCSKWNFSMCKRSVDIWGHLYHVLSVNSLILSVRDRVTSFSWWRWRSVPRLK